MEINKDEAVHCLSIAKKHYLAGNTESAVKFTKKSIKLYPTSDAQAFLEKLNTHGSSHASTPSEPKKEMPAKSSAPSSNDKETKKSHTPQQVKAVKEILACGTDYYKVLKLEKSCTEIEIKKSYRKLALQFHPDKNGAPGADEAFKLISKAFTVLSDPQKRAIHDAGGSDPEMRHQQAAHGFSSGGFARGPYAQFGEDISPEELFNMFFQGGFGGPGFSSATFVGPGFRTHTFSTGGAGRRPSSTQRAQNAGSNTWTIFIQILPLLVLFGYSLLSGLLTDNTPIFSLRQTTSYSQTRMTGAHHVPYFVNPSAFRQTAQNPYKLARVEQQVEMDWVRGLQHACQVERRDRRAQINAASGIFGIGRDEKKYQAALRLPTKSCDEIRRFGYNPDTLV